MSRPRSRKTSHQEQDILLVRCREYFRDMDLNDDGRLCSKEFLNMIEIIGMELDVTQLRRAYDIADVNKDGTISYREFIDAYTSQLAPSILGCDEGRTSNRHSLLLCNERSDGHIIKQPVVRTDSKGKRSHNRPSSRHEEDILLVKCREYFRNMDTNDDGRWSSKEFLNMIESIGMELDVTQLRNAYDMVDQNKDGAISYKEFMDAFGHLSSKSSAKSSESVTSRRPISRNNSAKARNRNSRTDLVLSRCREYFREMDLNNDGSLDAKEFLNMIKVIGMELDVTLLKKAFDMADQNKDGTISYREFIDAYTSQLSPKCNTNRRSLSRSSSTRSRNRNSRIDLVLSKCREYFEDMDLNGDGKLNAEEFAQMIDHLGLEADATELRKAYSKADKDNDGTISFQEFLDAYTNETVTNREINLLNEALSNAENRISDKDVKDGCSYFWNSDMDCDGRLSSSEFSIMLKSLGMKVNHREASKAFKMADVDGDGFINFGEFVKAYLNKMTSKSLTSDQIKHIFHKHDPHGNGFLTKHELGEALRNLGNNLDESSLDRVMSIISKNNAGRVTLNEFCVFLGLGF